MTPLNAGQITNFVSVYMIHLSKSVMINFDLYDDGLQLCSRCCLSLCLKQSSDTVCWGEFKWILSRLFTREPNRWTGVAVTRSSLCNNTWFCRIYVFCMCARTFCMYVIVLGVFFCSAFIFKRLKWRLCKWANLDRLHYSPVDLLWLKMSVPGDVEGLS